MLAPYLFCTCYWAVGPGEGRLRIMTSSLQIGALKEIDVTGTVFHAINNPVGFEKDLPEFADTQVRQLLRVGAAFRQVGQFPQDFADSVNYIVGAFRRIVCCDPTVQFLQLIG